MLPQRTFDWNAMVRSDGSSDFSLHSVVQDLCAPVRFLEYGKCARARQTTKSSVAEILCNFLLNLMNNGNG